MSFNIESIKRKMLVKYPFFGSVVANVNYKENKEIPAVAGTDGQTIYYNPDFLKKLKPDEQTFTFAHEVCHIAFDHIRRSEGKDPDVWNTATDGVINQFLKRDGLKLVEGVVDIAEAINYDAEQLYDKLLKEKHQSQGQNRKSNQQNQQGSSSSEQKQQSQGQNSSEDSQKQNENQSQGQNSEIQNEEQGQEQSNSQQNQQASSSSEQEQQSQGQSSSENSQKQNKNQSQGQNSEIQNEEQGQEQSNSQQNQQASSSEQEQQSQQSQGQSSSKDSQKQNENQSQGQNSETQNEEQGQEQSNLQQNQQALSSSEQEQQSQGQSSSEDSQKQNENQSQGQGTSSSESNPSEEQNHDVGHDTHSMWKDALKKQKEAESKDKKESQPDEQQTEEQKQQKERLQQEIDKISKMGEQSAFNKNLEEKRKELEALKQVLSQQAMRAGTSTNRNQLIINDIGKSKPIIDWRYVLRETIQYDVDWSYKNAYVEDGVVSANLEEQPMPETEIVLDTSDSTSGSIDKLLLKNFLRECKNILQHSKVKVGCFDTEFYGFHEIRTEEDIENMRFEGGGGTDFNVAVRAFTRRVENKIIFTDGNASMPDIPMDAIWIVFGEIEINPKGGKVIQINKEQLDKLYSLEQDISYKGKSR